MLRGRQIQVAFKLALVFPLVVINENSAAQVLVNVTQAGVADLGRQNLTIENPFIMFA